MRPNFLQNAFPKATTRQVYETMMVFALAALVIGWTKHWTPAYVLAGGILLCGLLFPAVFRPVAAGWLALGTALGYLTSHVLLAILYLLLVVPAGWIRRWMGKDTLQLLSWKSPDPDGWKESRQVLSEQDLKHPF